MPLLLTYLCSVAVLADYIDSQHRIVVSEEEKLTQRNLTMTDSRVHALIYFIPPLGHSLRQVDIAALKAVHNKTNVILAIAKADTMTKEEMAGYRQRVMKNVAEHGINLFTFRDDSGAALVRSILFREQN